MKEGFLAKGAEAAIFREGGVLIKERLEKRYRLPQLDRRIRLSRTRREARYLKAAGEARVLAPKLLEVDEENYLLKIQYIEGPLLKDLIDDGGDFMDYARKAGESLKKLHEAGFVHNDLTTSNMIASDGELYFIDFGLAYPSRRLEDYAMDLVVFKKSLAASHPKQYEKFWSSLQSAYNPGETVLKRVEKIMNRVRYS